MKSLKNLLLLASFAAAVAASGCATTDLNASLDGAGNGDGGFHGDSILEQMAKDSQAGGD